MGQKLQLDTMKKIRASWVSLAFLSLSPSLRTQEVYTGMLS
jgi:hypothetical protein